VVFYIKNAIKITVMENIKSQKHKVAEIKIDKNGKIRGILPVICFKEDETFLSYCPVLDLVGYGDSEKEAADSLQVVIDEYFTYAIANNTLHEDLLALGWKQHKDNLVVAPLLTSLINKNSYLSDIINFGNCNKANIQVSY
jgi:hypothetical protein